MHIIGLGGHAKVVADIIQKSKQEITGVWDDNPLVRTFMQHGVLGTIEEFKDQQSGQFIIAIGDNRVRKKMATSFAPCTVNAIHPSSEIASTAKIGFGNVILPNVSVNAAAIIGDHVILNTNASIDHDCMVADYVHISPQVGIAGNVQIGEGTQVGIGASVIQGIKIGKWATIGAGAVIIRDVPDYAVVVGNPGRIIKYNSSY
jgi:sugar O-acyltransferase (sialic acid O-acetyltransferase NeuD family)